MNNKSPNRALKNDLTIIKILMGILIVMGFFNILLSLNVINTYKDVSKKLDAIDTQITTMKMELDMISEKEDQLIELENQRIKIMEEQEKIKQTNTTTTENEAVIENAVVEPVVINTTDISKPSNLTADQMDKMIQDTLSAKGKKTSTLYGLGSALEAMEKNYNVNALFALSVASLEGSWGNSKAAKNRNNPFGVYSKGSPKYFDSTADAVDYFGRLIRNSYIDKGHNTISSINKKYCPPNTKWANDVTSIMKSYASHV